MLTRTWSNRDSHVTGRNARWHSHFGKQLKQFLQNLTLPYYPSFVFFGIHPTELKTYIHTKPAHGCFYSSFIHNWQKQERNRCLLVGEWLNTVVHPYSGRFSSIETKWVMHGEPKCVLLSKRSQSAKATYCMIPAITFWKGQNYWGGEKINGCQGFG